MSSIGAFFQRRQPQTLPVLHHHLEAAGLPQTADGRRHHHRKLRLFHAGEPSASGRPEFCPGSRPCRACPRARRWQRCVKMVETLAVSSMEKPPRVTQLAMPGVFLRMSSTRAEASLTRGCEEPSGSIPTTMAYPWSSSGRKPVGCRAKSRAPTPMMRKNTSDHEPGAVHHPAHHGRHTASSTTP